MEIVNEKQSILTLENVADYLKVHPSTIYRMLKRKQLPAFKVGRDWRFNREAIDRWRADAERNRPACASERKHGYSPVTASPWSSNEPRKKDT